MADRVNDQARIVRASDEHAAEARLPAAVRLGLRSRARREPSPHAHRFRAAVGLLVGVAIGAIVVAMVAAGSGGRTASIPWSDWRPVDGGTQGAWEIANHIAPTYRISATDQLDVVTVVNLTDPSSSASATSTSSGLQLAIRNGPASDQVSLLPGKTIAYNLCGIGTTDCAIGAGVPSESRLLLLRREALELALYTLKYLGNVQNVLAILPPGITIQQSTLTLKPPSPHSTSNVKPTYTAVLFSRGELIPAFEHPLTDVLPQQPPPSVPQLSAWSQTAEALLVSRITADGLFTERLVQGQDGSHVMLLNPQPPQ